MPKILVAEDSPEMLANINTILSLNGFTVITAKNGLEGIEKAKTYFPDLIISDIMMPAMDGLEMLNYLRENEFLQTIPVIFLTAKVERKDLRNGMAAGADDYITKPFRASELLEAVDAQLKKRELIKTKYDEIAQNISIYIPHELRTPLIAIMGYADLLLNDPEGWDEETRISMLSNIKKASGKLRKTIEKFISYSEIETLLAEKKDYRTEETEEISVKENIFLIAQKISGGYKREKDLHISLGDARLKMHEKHFNMLFEELLDNAFKFSERNQFVEIREVRGENSFALEIRNEGRGMSAEEMKKINPFIQHNRQQYSQPGSGLGLITALKVSRLYDIDFEMKSEMEKYFSVKLCFPKNNIAHCA